MILFVFDLDDPDPDKSSSKKPPRQAVDLDAPADAQPSKSEKGGGGKLEILRDTDTPYRKRRTVDPVKERKRRTILTTILIIATLAALAFVGVNLFLNRKPTFETAKDAPLPIRKAPTPVIQSGRPAGPAPVRPHSGRPNPLATMPGLNPGGEERDRDQSSSGIH